VLNHHPSRLTIVGCLLLVAAAAQGQWVEDSIDVGGWNVSGLVYNSRAGVVYGRCFYGENFFAIACSTNELVSQIPVTYPIATAYNSTDNRAYCTFSYHGEDSVLVVDGSTHTRIKAVRVDGAYQPVWDRISNRLYITCFGYRDIAVYDCASDSVVARIPLPDDPIGLTINTRRRKLYAQGDANMAVTVVDLTTNQVTSNVHVGDYLNAGCYSTAGDKYYCDGAEGIAVIDGVGDSLLKQIGLPRGYSLKDMVAVESESLVMAAACSGNSDSVFSIDVVHDSLVAAVRVKMPRELVYSPASRVVYCTNGSLWDNLSVISADGMRVVGSVQVGDEPSALVTCPPRAKLYVGHSGMTPMVYVVRDQVGGVGEVVGVGIAAKGVLRARPNPFRAEVGFEVCPAAASSVLRVYTPGGRLVRHVGTIGQDSRSRTWNGTDQMGRAAPPGIYLAVVEGRATARVQLVKLR